MKKYIIILILFTPFIKIHALVKQDKIKTSCESKDGFYYLKLGSDDGLAVGSILSGFNDKKKPLFIEILGILGPHYSLFQKIEFVWDNKEKKIIKNYSDRADLDSALEISEINDSFEQMFVNKFKEVETLYKNAKENYDKKRFNVSKKYFDDCLAIVDNYKDSKEILNSLNNEQKKYRAKPELNEDIWKKSKEQVDKFKAEDKLNEALSILQKSALDYPLSKKVRNELGSLYSEMGYIYKDNDYFKEAINEMEELLFIDPGALGIRRELAFLYYYQGDKDKAMEHFEKLFSLSKDGSAVELRNLINKLLLISSNQSNNSVKGMCSLC
ncbi:MAG: hypothetical protein PHX78_02335, partial [bacterium]|nr:hypothetical protein [bacterium]